MSKNILGKNPHYHFRGQDPVIGEMWFFVRTSNLKLMKIAENCGLSYSTLYNWFVSKETRVPLHDSVQIFFRSFGIEYGQKNKLSGKHKLKAVA